MVAVAALALLAAACGADDDGAAVPPTNESAAAETQSDSVEVDEAALQAILDQWRTGVGADGATLSLRVPGHDDIHLASGIDDRDPDTPMPTDGTFGIASVTKTFVAALALQLVDEGKLSLDEPVAAWLPELPHADQITLAMLLGHTSGLGPFDIRRARARRPRPRGWSTWQRSSPSDIPWCGPRCKTRRAVRPGAAPTRPWQPRRPTWI
jgi:D-alanyl-D-alanine carboxypeptidase